MENGKILKIYIEEKDCYEKTPLYEWIVQKAQEQNLKALTVLRGIEGFGPDHKMHTVKILALSIDLPIIVEIVDTPGKIDAFIPLIEPIIGKGIMTSENCELRIFQ